jgi:hypothetical protein
MNPYDAPDGRDFRPDEDFDSDMSTVKPPRWRHWRLGRPITAASVAVVALAGGAGIGYAGTHSLAAKGATDTAVVAAAAPAAAPSPSASGMPAMRGWAGGPGWFGGVLHGQVTVPKSGGGYRTLDVQDGTVTAVSTGSVTVKSADGFTHTYTVTSNTLVAAGAAGIGSVKTGNTIFVIATVSGSTATAANILDLTAVKASHAAFGFPAHPANP